LVIRPKRKKKNRNEENLIPLINIVFLILVFFLAAGMLRSFQEEEVRPPEANFERSKRPVEPILIDADGRITIHGIEHDQLSLRRILLSQASLGAIAPPPIVADRNLPAHKLLDIIKATGIKKIRLITRKRAAP
jgi:biopolymer transport protein ExbD